MIPLCLERIDRYSHNQHFLMKLFRLANNSPIQDKLNGYGGGDSAVGDDGTDTDAINEDRVQTDGHNENEVIMSRRAFSFLSCISVMLQKVKDVFIKMKTLLQQDKHRKEQSYVILLMYVVWVAVFAPKEGKLVGLINAIVVFVVDCAVNQLVYCPGLSLKKGSFSLLSVGAAVRATVASAGMRTWFIG